MIYGKSLLINLFILVLLGSSLGLVFVYHQYFQGQLTEKNLALNKAQVEINTLKHEMTQIKSSYTVTTSPKAENEKSDLYAQQLERMAQEQQSLQKRYDALQQAMTEYQTKCNTNAASVPNTDQESGKSDQNTQPETSLVPAAPQINSTQDSAESIAKPAETIIEKGHFECPTMSIVNNHLDTGQWSDVDMNWWVDFTFRPLRDDEAVKKPFQALFDGTYIDCYYRIGPAQNEEEISNTWMVIKGASTVKKIIPSATWKPCEVEGCEQKCDYEKSIRCKFELEDRR